MTRLPWGCGALLAAALLLGGPAPARAQDDDAAALRLAEPDFTLIALPTSLRLPQWRSAFRVTHRFNRPLNDDFGDVAGDLFGLDSGAQIGLEYRMGIIPNGQVGIHRTSDKTIQLFSQYRVFSEQKSFVDVSGYFSIEGRNNFQNNYSPTFGAIVSRTIGDVAAIYVEPMWVNNTNVLPSALVDNNSTFFVGIGTRVRVRPSVYVVAEVAPHSGYKPGVTQGAFAVEKRVGGHTFQLNFSNGRGTTMGQIATGGPPDNDWFLGFNISRKFF